MMKSPSEQVDPTNMNSMNQMNPGRRMSWQGQYQMNQAPQPQHHQSSEGQPPGPTQYFPDKLDMYPTPSSSYPASSMANPGVDQWQKPSPSAVGGSQYAHSEPSPAQPNSHFTGEHRDANSGVNSNGMSGAAAAAAAAMVAAAHTAKGSPGYQKPANAMSPLLNAVHKPSPMPPAQRAAPFHPNYANVQSGVPPQNAAPPAGDPTVPVPNHSYPPTQPTHPMNRPPNPNQYGQWVSPQPNAVEHRPSPGFQHSFENQQPIPGPERVPSYASDSISGPMSNASSHDSEDSRTKTVSARSTNQKLSALYEPDEPGRKEFIDSVLRYWEEKELPLKHAPMMGGRTLDLFNLYQHVRNRGFMQEVSRSKKWTEISNTMGLGSTSASGFTLKKQYCKYLFGFECRTERQEPEPQEALTRVSEANRKKKQLADQSHAKATDNSHYGEIPPPNMMHHQHSMPRPPQHHPGPMGYHHQQMPGYHPSYRGHGHSVHNPMTGPYEQQSYGGPANSGWHQQNPHYPPSHPMSQPRYSYRHNGIPPPTHPQAGPPMPPQVYPNIQNRGRSPSQPPFNQPYMNQPPPPAPHHEMPPDMPPIVRNITPKPLSNMPESHPASPAVKNLVGENALSDGGISGSMSQPMGGFQSPASSITAATEDGNSNMSDTPSSRPNTATPQSYGSMLTGKANEILPTTIPNASNHVMPVPGGRSNTPKISDAINSPMPHVPRPDFNKTSHMRRGVEMNPMKMSDPGMRPPGPSQYYPGSSSVGQESGYMSGGPYLPPPRGPERPPAPGMYQTPHSYHQTYSPYGGNSQMNVMRQYGQKRMPSMDNFGPPSKMPRPYNAEQQRVRGYPPRPEINTPHNYHPPYSQPAHPMRPYHPPGQHPSIQQHQRHLPIPRNESPATRNHTPDPHKSRTHVAHPPESASNFLKGLVSCPPMRPITGYYHPGSHFPQGSVEAVMPVGGKMKEKSGHDIGVIEAWQIIMSLKSGLYAENIWALNALTILLHDNRTVRQVILTQLPGLLNIIIEHYRFCLHELFGISKLDVTESQREDDESDDSQPDAENLATTMAMKCMSSPSTLNIRDKQMKYAAAPTKLLSPYCKLPVKMVAGEDNFPLLLDTLWNNPEKPAMSEFVPLSGFKSKIDENSNLGNYKDFISKIRPQMDCNSEKAEMTFEDMLSIPSFMRSNEQKKASHQKVDVKKEACEVECKSEPSNNETADDNGREPNDCSTIATAGGSTITSKSDHKENDSNTNASHIQSCLNRFAWDCDVALLEEEAAGFPGNIGFKAPSGVNSWHIAVRGLEYVFSKRPVGKDSELVVRALCLSNIIRSLSCAFANHYELRMHQNFFSSLCGTLLLGHKHRVRCTKFSKCSGIEFQYNSEESEYRTNIDKLSILNTSSALSTPNHLVNANEITNNCPDSNNLDSSDTKSEIKSTESETTKDEIVVKTECETENDNLNVKKEPEEPSKSTEDNASSEQHTPMTFEHNDRDHHDPWWWDCVRQLREDSLVVLANLSTSLDLSVLPGEGNALAILDACLHWCVCPSADAQDPSPTHSAQSLGIEILTKLSMKESNVDLILATKPYSRLEKFLKILIIMSGNRQNPMLREFSFVLLCNMCGEESCARAVALQTGAISNFLSFLEECEETGLRHQRVFTAGQERINCGTVSYMMQKCALILLKLARMVENRPLFLKHQLRLVSLSMSGLLGNEVLSLLSAVLFELSREPPNR